ncbi:Acg family FMN-binding oxidoreductase [Undibacterium crateris]|uniref:Acg family FMN-binding oxidoreductase n=1 Tax=Undibacterium crateris TaxID=2528175 RepID=UPI001389A457|nr:twin-arginine translocation pathway signal protein [Undibacterium crateris]NDI84086.1 twin-arginine translocation pathway signal protein [Undibacterium crateris]
MDRRKFIRVVGGVSIAAATISSAGCAQRMPASAIASWRGPGHEADVRRWILGYAILAPHSHNLQSWLVDLRTPDEILLRCDTSRLLPEADPFSRQIMISHGAFLELLDMASRECGLRADISLFPEGQFTAVDIDQRPVARIRLVADSTLVREPLFTQILKRRTNRESYELTRPIAPDTWLAMADSVKPNLLQFGHVGPDQPGLLQQHRKLAAEAWRIELTTARVVLETYSVLRIGAAEVELHRDGMALLDGVPVLMSTLGMFNRHISPAADDYAVTSQIRDFNSRLASTPAFLWLITPDNDRQTQINAGRAFVRIQLAASAAGVSLQPLSQALQEYSEQAQSYAEIRRLLELSQPGQTVQMWARAGFAPAIGPAPRRGVDAQLVRA